MIEPPYRPMPIEVPYVETGCKLELDDADVWAWGAQVHETHIVAYLRAAGAGHGIVTDWHGMTLGRYEVRGIGGAVRATVAGRTYAGHDEGDGFVFHGRRIMPGLAEPSAGA